MCHTIIMFYILLLNKTPLLKIEKISFVVPSIAFNKTPLLEKPPYLGGYLVHLVKNS